MRGESRSVYKDRWIRKLKSQGSGPVLRVLEECPREEWRDRERHWIASLLGSGSSLSNRTSGGDGTEGYTHSEETKAKMSESMKKSWADPETRERQTAAILSALSSPEVRAKMSAHRKAIFSDPERAREALAPAMAAKRTPEGRRQSSEVMKKVWATPGFASRQAVIMKAAMGKPETRKRLSDAARAQWADPETKEKMREALRAGWVKRRARMDVS